MVTGDLQQTKDSREGLEGSLEKIQRSLRHLDKQVQEWERWFVLASTLNDETESLQVKIGSGKFAELPTVISWGRTPIWSTRSWFGLSNGVT